MQYIPIGTGKWIELDEATNKTRVVVLSEVLAQEAALQEEAERLNGFDISVEEKARRFDEMYPTSKELAQYIKVTEQLQKLQALKENLK